MSVLRVPVSPADHIHGSSDALVTMVEYGDYECPCCARVHPVIKRILKHSGGRFVFRIQALSADASPS